MKKPVFFVQNNYVQRITVPVCDFAWAKGHALEDRSSMREFDPEDCGIDWSQYHPVLPIGSVQMVRHLKASPSLGKYMLYSEEAFSTAYWTAIFGPRAVNHRGREATVAEVTVMLAAGEKLHVRPDHEDKAFIAAVFDKDSWKTVCEERYLPESLVCWASPVVELHGEWRCWVIGGKVIEISQYRKDGVHHRTREVAPEVWAAAQSLADSYIPAPCVVLDVALTDSGYQVLEFNPIHGSGWYAADVDKILTAWLAWSVDHFGPAD